MTQQHRTPFDYETANEQHNGHVGAPVAAPEPPELRNTPARPASARRAEGLFVADDEPNTDGGIAAAQAKAAAEAAKQPKQPATIEEKLALIVAEGDKYAANAPQLDATLSQVMLVANGQAQLVGWYQQQIKELQGMLSPQPSLPTQE